MFSFHKPKIYRSISGCCICKAKSSSSRFTDSKKYESEFERCFRINEKRSGEICNACVLLVKRWKKLPAGNTRDWHHVVDARAGPGTKSIKGKNNNTSTTTASSHFHHYSHNHHHKKLLKPKNPKGSQSNNITEDIAGDDCISECSVSHCRIPSPNPSDSSDSDEDIDEDEEMDDDFEDEEVTNAKRNEKAHRSTKKSNFNESSNSRVNTNNNKRNNIDPTNTATNTKISSFLDMSFWRKEKICCGIIFKGPDNELLIYPKLLRPCCRRNNNNNNNNILNKTETSNVNGSDAGSVTSSLIEDDACSNASSGNISLI